MAHCININSQEYIDLVKATSLGQRELKARIAAWQEITNNYDKYPSVEEVMNIHSSIFTPKMEQFNTKEYLAEIVPSEDINNVEVSIDNIIDNNMIYDINSIHKSLNNLLNGTLNHSNDFFNAFHSITSNKEKQEVLKYVSKDKNLFSSLSEMYQDYLSYPKEYRAEYGKIITDIFDRMYTFTETLNNSGTLLKPYIVNSSNTSINTNLFNNDLRVWEKEMNKRIPIYHSGKTSSQIQGSINHNIGIFKRSFSPNVEIKVSKPKETKNGLVTYVYALKPSKENYGIRKKAEEITEAQRNVLNKNRNFLFGESQNSSVKEILTKLAENKEPLAKTLLKYVREDSNIEIVESDYLYKKEGDVNGEYNPETKTITLPLAGMTPTTILHEILHSMTHEYITKNPNSQEVKDLEKIMDKIKDQLKNDPMYEELYAHSLSSLDEFVTGVYTNQNFLNRIKLIEPTTDIKEYKNIFQELWDKILRFFTKKGIYVDNSSYEQAFSIISNIINKNYEYLGSKDDFISGKILNNIEGLGNLNKTFIRESSPTKVVNSPYTETLKRLNSNFEVQDIKDLASVLTSQFSDLVSYYQEEMPTSTREEVIKTITPTRLFKEVKEDLEIKLEEVIDNGLEQNYIDNFNKFLDNYSDIAMIASTEINFLEGLKFTPNDLETWEYNLKEGTDNGMSQIEEMDTNSEFNEVTPLEGWMKNYQYESVNDSLTNKIKRVLRGINELDKRGNPVKNIIGLPRKLNLDVIKNDLLRSTQSMITSKDMLPVLGILAKEKPWVKSIINHLEDDNELASQFYSVFRKDAVQHSIITTVENSDGTIDHKTMVINKTNDLNLWIENWRNALENKHIYNDIYSIYDSEGKLLPKKIDNNIKILQELLKEWKTILKQDNIELRKDFLSRKNITIKNQLNAIGIPLTSLEVKDLLMDALVDTQEIQELFGVTKSNFNIDTILDKLIGTNTWAKNNHNKEGVKALSLIQENKTNYNTIARLVANTLEELVEGSVHENGKSYYTFLQPSYLTKLTKQLKNISGNKKDFNEFIDKEFTQYSGTIYNPNTNSYNISWLNDLVDSKEGKYYRDLFDHKKVLNYNKTEYSGLNPADYQTMLLVEYFSPSVNSKGDDRPKAWYHVPILAEAPSAEFIKFDRIITNYKDNVSEKLLSLFTYEYNRIKTVRARKEGIENGSIKAINSFDKNGEKFHFLTFLNNDLKIIDEIVNKEKGTENILPTELFNFIQDRIKQELDSKASKAMEYMNEIGVLEKTENGRYKNLHSLGINEGNIQDKIGEYFYNSYLATANIIQLTSTDLAYYKNVEDFQKRNKEIHAPGTMVNTQAKYNGERIGKDRETYIILKDQELNSTDVVYNHIEQVLINNPLLSKIERDNILSNYKRKGGANNITDAQAYRSLESAKTVIAMSTGWNDKLEASYQRLNKGKWDIEDYNVIMQAFKPFVYTQTTVDSGILLDANDESKGNRMIKVPTQHKNSEAILLPMMEKQFNSPKINGMLKAMKNHNIDVIMFDSAVKVGLQGVLDINEMENPNQISEYIGNFKNNNQVFKTISYEDYKIQQPIPEHLQDTSQLFGTQLRKLAISDISPDAIFNIKGKDFTKQELIDLYNNTIIENTIEAYRELISTFSSNSDVQKMLEEELIWNARYSKDLLNAVQLDNNGQFALPLFDPSQSNRVQQLMNSIWKSRVTNQRIKGGKAVQMSSFGLSDDLELKFQMVDGKPAIEYMECYLPFWSEKMPKDWESKGFIDPNTGIMDVQKMLDAKIIDEEFLEAIAYRIPTEDKYSMWPLKVKGFLPRNSGGNIVLPREITTITGSDFDIDSMYMIMKEFKFINNYNYKQAWRDFYAENPEQLEKLNNHKEETAILKALSNIFTNDSTGVLSQEQTTREFKQEEGISEQFKEWFSNNNQNYLISQEFVTITPNLDLDVKDMNLQQRNNLLIDVIRGVLSHPDTASKQLNPGNFDGPKRTARRLNILSSGQGYTWNQIKNMSLEELDKISNKNQLDILDFTTQIALHKQNMTAAKLIGIVANHSTNHAVRQQTEIEVNHIEKEIEDPDNKGKKITTLLPRFILNGQFYTSLHSILNPNNTAYISKNYASFLAASVDAVKDPVLSFFNLNTFTADSAMLLTGLGYDFDSIGLLLRQPAIEELVAYHDKNSKKGLTKTLAIEEKINDYKQFLNNVLNTPTFNRLSDYNGNMFTPEKMAEMINLNAKIKELNTLEGKEKDAFINKNRGDIQEFYNYQYQVLLNYKNILDTSQDLADFVGASKADTGGGGAGPTIADTKAKLEKITKNKDNANPKIGIPRLANTDIIQSFPKEILNNEDELRKSLRESKLGFIQGFTSLGLQATKESLSKYFPHYNNYFDAIFDIFKSNLRSNKVSTDLMNQIYTEFFAYYMSQYKGFSREGANEFIRDFPDKFQKLKNSNEEFANLQIIKNIQYINPSADVPVAKLKFKSGGRLSPNVRDTMIMEWESMLYKPKLKKIAMELFRYNYFVNGFGFGTTSFIHLAPTALKLAIPNFTDNLNKLMQNDNSDINNSRFNLEQLKTFVDQYYRNHLGNRQLVPDLGTAFNEILEEDNGTIKEEVTTVLNEDQYLGLLTSKKDIIPYIAVSIKGNQEYYKVFEDTNSEGPLKITFQRVTPLGIKNNFLEYDFNNSDLESNFKSNNSGPVNPRDEYSEHQDNVIQSQDAQNYENDWDTSSAQEYPSSSITLEDAPSEVNLDSGITENDVEALLNMYSKENNPTDINSQPLINEVGQDKIDNYINRC